jgi:lactoylglutathione lyase
MINHISLIETILFVSDQAKSTAFYEGIFRQKADLNVPGMTEFNMSTNCKLGLMPESGIGKILSTKTPHPSTGSGIPRCELYFRVDDIKPEFENALANGAKLISPITDMDWGDTVCYFADPDGHIIAFAEKTIVGEKQ